MRKENGSAEAVAVAKREKELAFYASKFLSSSIGKFIKADLDGEITKLLNEIAGYKPLNHDEYITKVGALNALRGWQGKLLSHAKNKEVYEKLYQQRVEEYARQLAAANQ